MSVDLATYEDDLIGRVAQAMDDRVRTAPGDRRDYIAAAIRQVLAELREPSEAMRDAEDEKPDECFGTWDRWPDILDAFAREHGIEP